MIRLGARFFSPFQLQIKDVLKALKEIHRMPVPVGTLCQTLKGALMCGLGEYTGNTA